MTKEQIYTKLYDVVERTATLFPDAKSMSELDAADFKDNAGVIFDVVLAAREALSIADGE